MPQRPLQERRVHQVLFRLNALQKGHAVFQAPPLLLSFCCFDGHVVLLKDFAVRTPPALGPHPGLHLNNHEGHTRGSAVVRPELQGLGNFDNQFSGDAVPEAIAHQRPLEHRVALPACTGRGHCRPGVDLGSARALGLLVRPRVAAAGGEHWRPLPTALLAVQLPSRVRSESAGVALGKPNRAERPWKARAGEATALPGGGDSVSSLRARVGLPCRSPCRLRLNQSCDPPCKVLGSAGQRAGRRAWGTGAMFAT